MTTKEILKELEPQLKRLATIVAAMNANANIEDWHHMCELNNTLHALEALRVSILHAYIEEYIRDREKHSDNDGG